MPKAFVLTGLTFGDEGKGTITDALARRYKIPLVIRYSGGAQCAHNVVTPEGVHHTFAQFGSGTLAGGSTALTKDVLVNPLSLIVEGKVLEGKGVTNVFDKIVVSENALVITPFHKALNKIKEHLRGENRHGSCGMGIGETRSYGIRNPERALYIRDLKSPIALQTKLEIIQSDLRQEVEKLCAEKSISIPNLLKLDHTVPQKDMSFAVDVDNFYQSGNYFKIFEALYRKFVDTVAIVPDSLISERITKYDTVWEAAQGILLDEDYGFHPYTTWSKVTDQFAMDALATAGISRSNIERIGIMRAYGHRHGAGPFPTEDESFRISMLEAHNRHNDWQGAFRMGLLDLNLVAYSIWANKGIDSLAVTHMDTVKEFSTVVTNYPFLLNLLTPSNFAEREEQTKKLMNLQFKDCAKSYVKREEFLEFIMANLHKNTSVVSSGPKSTDKVFFLK